MPKRALLGGFTYVEPIYIYIYIERERERCITGIVPYRRLLLRGGAF